VIDRTAVGLRFALEHSRSSRWQGVKRPWAPSQDYSCPTRSGVVSRRGPAAPVVIAATIEPEETAQRSQLMRHSVRVELEELDLPRAPTV